MRKLELKASMRVIVIGLVFLSLSMIFAVSAVDATIVKVDPASQTLTIAGSFSVDVIVEDVTYMGADQLTLNFDPGAISVISVIEGGFLKSAGSTIGVGMEDIDNVNGHVTFFYALVTSGIGVDGSGTLATISFTADASAEGTYDLELTEIVLGEGEGNEITVDAVFNGTVTIGQPTPTKNETGEKSPSPTPQNKTKQPSPPQETTKPFRIPGFGFEAIGGIAIATLIVITRRRGKRNVLAIAEVR